MECERSFSKMNIIKNKLRNQLSNEKLNDLMLISLHGQDIKDFNINSALTH